jgi:hypothetical protein
MVSPFDTNEPGTRSTSDVTVPAIGALTMIDFPGGGVTSPGAITVAVSFRRSATVTSIPRRFCASADKATVARELSGAEPVTFAAGFGSAFSVLSVQAEIKTNNAQKIISTLRIASSNASIELSC